MKIENIRIQNFRSFEDETIPLNDYSCFVGGNGAGKSTVLSALNVFFGNVTSSTPTGTVLEKEDFHNKDITRPIKITVTFKDLSQEATEELGDYVRQGNLIVTALAEWDENDGKAHVRQQGSRLGMSAFAESYFGPKSRGAKVGELKPAYQALRTQYPDLPNETTGPKMETALRDYEETNSHLCVLLPSGDEFYGANSGKLKRFIQWVYVPAVKDAQDEGEESKNGALGQLLARTVRATTNFGDQIEELRRQTLQKFRELLEENQGALNGVRDRLKVKLAEWSHTDTNFALSWLTDEKNSVKVAEPVAGVFTGEGEFTGSLSRMGHGLQRSYLLALLTELAGLDTENAPTLILACEEPELYQHPPQARRLASVFETLSKTGNTQVLVTTHSPFFVKGESFENVRLARKSRTTTHVSHVSSSAFADYLNEISHHRERPTANAVQTKLSQSLQPQINEMFFCSFPVFVEGLEDVAFLTAGLHLYGLWDEFHSRGCHLIPVGGKGHLIQPVALANKLNFPYFLIFDCDGICDPDYRDRHVPDNKTLFKLVGEDDSNAFPPDGLASSKFRAWPNTMGDVIEADFDPTALQGYKTRARQYCGGAKSINKNGMFIAEWLRLAKLDNLESITLRELCEAVITEARG